MLALSLELIFLFLFFEAVVRLPSVRRDLKMLVSSICRRKRFLLNGQGAWFDSWIHSWPLLNFKKCVHCSKALLSRGAGITVYSHFLLPLGVLVCLIREVSGFLLSPTNFSLEISQWEFIKPVAHNIAWARWRYERCLRESYKHMS